MSFVGRLPTLEVRFETLPGDQAQVDFAQFQVTFTDEPRSPGLLAVLEVERPSIPDVALHRKPR